VEEEGRGRPRKAEEFWRSPEGLASGGIGNIWLIQRAASPHIACRVENGTGGPGVVPPAKLGG